MQSIEENYNGLAQAMLDFICGKGEPMEPYVGSLEDEMDNQEFLDACEECDE